MAMYAVVETGGKQYRVEEQKTIEVERLDAPAGGTVVLDKVLMIQGGDGAEAGAPYAGGALVGAPYVAGARVVCRVIGEHKTAKTIAFRYKAKENIRKKKGHRQRMTMLMVERIETAG